MESYVNLGLLAAFIPTFLFVSITPGLCMTLSMTLGMSMGFRKTLWMMVGELVGVGLVASCSVIGVAAIMLRYPQIFIVFKLLGGAYLAYLGVTMWLSKGKMAISSSNKMQYISRGELITQGFVTAIANPKGWAFFIALLPPFISQDLALVPQLIIFIAIILILEFFCLVLYCLGGSTMRLFLQNDNNVKTMNRIAGSLMIGVAIWLVLG